jgi:predicted amidophosphoribosyltransferase
VGGSDEVNRRRRQQTWAFTAKRCWNAFLNVLFMDDKTSVCLFCQRPLHQERNTVHLLKASHNLQADDIPGVCLFCLQDIQMVADKPRCRTLLVKGSSGKAQRIPVISARRYDGVMRNAIRQWKYDGVVALTPWFANMAAAAYKALQADSDSQLRSLSGTASVTGSVTAITGSGAESLTGSVAESVTPTNSPTVIVPVPTTRDRLRKRGYHHVGLLAAEVAELLNLPVMPALERKPDGSGSFTQSQTAKNAKERLRGLQGRFYIAPGTSVTGTNVLLVDDIVTTGATLYTCAATLLEAGVQQVQALVIADVV